MRESCLFARALRLLFLVLCLMRFGVAEATPLASPVLPDAAEIVVDEDEAARQDGNAVSADVPDIPVYLSVVCGEDETLAAAIQIIAEKKLASLERVAIVPSINETTVLLSFHGFKLPLAISEDQREELIVYSFAFGTTDVEFVGEELISLPRFLHHEAVVTKRGELTGAIEANVATTDENLFRILRESD